MSRTTKERPELELNHNVYILGAGFSRGGGAPLIYDFFERMRTTLPALESTNRIKEIDAVWDVLTFRQTAAAAAYRIPMNIENIEQLFSLASATNDEKLINSASLAIASTIDVCIHSKKLPQKLIHYNASYPQPSGWQKTGIGWSLPGMQHYLCTDYHLAAGYISGKLMNKTVAGKNTVITFNYDTLLDDALTDMGVPFNYSLAAGKYNDLTQGSLGDAPDTMKLLKLHGSMNWGVTNRSKKVSVRKAYNEVMVAAETPLLVPPTWRKTFAGALSSIWETAVKALKTATRIVVIGFSIPETDVHFKYLLAAGLKDNISLQSILFVNPYPDQRYLDRLTALFGSGDGASVLQLHETSAEQIFVWGHLAEQIGRRNVFKVDDPKQN